MKHTMKITVLVAAVMTVSLAGCAENADPKAAYDYAVKKNMELKDVDSSWKAVITTTQGGRTIHSSITADRQISNKGTDKMLYRSDTAWSAGGQTESLTEFFENGYFYSESPGQKVKYALDIKALMERAGQSPGGLYLTSADMKKLTVRNDGLNQVFSYTADPQKADAAFLNIMSLMISPDEIHNVKLKVKDCKGDCTVNKSGYYTDERVNLDFDMILEGQTIAVEMNIHSIVKDPGLPVDVLLPGTDGYEDIPAPAESSTAGTSESGKETVQKPTAA